MTVTHPTRVVQQATPMCGTTTTAGGAGGGGGGGVGQPGPARPTSNLVANACLNQTTSTGQKYLITQRTQSAVPAQSASSGQQIVQVVGKLEITAEVPNTTRKVIAIDDSMSFA